MTSRKYENTIMAKMTEIADIIRKAKKIPFGRVCVQAHIAPSTLYQWWRAVETEFQDITYERGVFMVKEEKHHRMPDGKLVAAKK